MAKDLSSSTDYVISLIFDDDDDGEGFSPNQCTEAQMQVRIASSADNVENCQRGNNNYEELETSIKLIKGNYGPLSGKKLKMVSDYRRSYVKSAGVKVPQYSVETLNDDQDLEIIIDTSNILYGANIIVID